MRGEAPIEGTDHVLKFDFNALVAVEEVTGKPLPQVLASMGDNVSFLIVRALVWAGLRREGISLEQAGDIISDAGLDQATRALEKALAAALPQGKGENPRKRAKAGTS